MLRPGYSWTWHPQIMWMHLRWMLGASRRRREMQQAIEQRKWEKRENGIRYFRALHGIPERHP